MMDDDQAAQPASTAALLLIIGEPFSEDHKALIIEEITKGFRSWDKEDTGIDLNEELAHIANRASLGEEGLNGERLIQHQSDNLSVEILVNPLAQTVKNSFKKLLIVPAPTKYVIYAGHAFQGTGAWVLQDDVFAFANLSQVFRSQEVETALKGNIEASLTIHTLAENHWGASISKADFTNHLRIQLNPPEKLEHIHGVIQFTAYISTFVTVTGVTDLLQASEQFGNISFTRPTLYIFPGCHGDSALFGINGFNLLVNGGYNRKACFWDFARHLDRVDAMLLTHLGADNIFGVSAALQRKTLENIHPQIGYLYFNGMDKALPQGGDGETSTKKPTLIFNLAEEANKMTQMAKQLGINPHPCTRPEKNPIVEPINLYHKLGHGSLDMYILNPVADSKELKEFFQHWNKQASNLGTSGPFPLQNAMSVCTLLVWKPYNPLEKIVRIFFPGNAPQHKVAEGLEKMKSFAFLKYPSCTAKDLQKPPAVKKGASARPSGSATARGSSRSTTLSSRSETTRSMNSSRLDSPRKPDTTRTRPTSASSPTKSSRPLKEDTKPTRLRDRADETKPKANRAAGTSSPSKPGSTSPRKTPSPTKGANGAVSPTKSTSLAKSPSPPKSPSPAKTASPPKSPTKSASPPKSPTKARSPEKSPEKEVSKSPEKEVSKAVSNHADQEIKSEVDQKKPELIESNGTKAESNAFHEQSPPVPDSASSLAKMPSVESALNGDAMNSAAQVNGDANDEEEVRPQALPEPPAMVISPTQESPVLPDYSTKIETDQQELSDFSKVEQELEKQDSEPSQDPAQDIPSSPEPTPLEETNPRTSFEASEQTEDALKGFETPVFSNDEPETNNSHAMEQKIQYGIDESSHAMAGIQEVDEDEHEEIEKTNDSEVLDKEALKEMGIYDDDEEEEEKSAFEKDEVDDEVRRNVRDPSEEIEKHTKESVEKNQEDDVDEEEVKDLRSSAERQFEDVEDEGIDDPMFVTEDNQDTSHPEVSDKESTPEKGDADSLDGRKPDSDKDVDETNTVQVNGSSEKDHRDASKETVPSIKLQPAESDEEEGNFDPVSQWGQPMGLPSPPPPSETRKGASSPQKATEKRPTSSATARSTTRNVTTTSDSRRRPATAPAKTTARGAARRPGSSRSSPQSAKVPPMPPHTTFYMDLTYIPNHGDPSYSDVEFFKRIRARYYVLSSLSPNPQVLDSLMEAKATWEQKELEVTLIPTYDNETLRHWMGLNRDKLQELHIDMTPAVSRCTIQLQDLETSLPAYRLEV